MSDLSIEEEIIKRLFADNAFSEFVKEFGKELSGLRIKNPFEDIDNSKFLNETDEAYGKIKDILEGGKEYEILLKRISNRAGESADELTRKLTAIESIFDRIGDELKVANDASHRFSEETYKNPDGSNRNVRSEFDSKSLENALAQQYATKDFEKQFEILNKAFLDNGINFDKIIASKLGGGSTSSNNMAFREYLSKELRVMGAGQGIDTLNMISEDNDDWLSRNDGSGLFIVLEKLKENFEKIGGVFEDDINPLKEWDASKDISANSKNVDILYKLFEEGGINTLITAVYKKLPRMKDNRERVDWDAYKELKEKGDPLHDVYTNLHYILGISNSLKNMGSGMNEKSFQYIADDYFSKYGNRLPLNSEQFQRAYNRAPKPETDTFHLDELLSEIAKGGNVHVSDIQKGLQAFGFPYEDLSKDPDFISRLKKGQLFGDPILGDSSNSKYSSKNDAELLLEILNKLEGGNGIYDRLLEILNGEVGELMESKKPDEKVSEEVFEKGELIKALALEYSERDEKGARFDLGNDSIKWAQYMPQLIKIYEDITGKKFDKSILPQSDENIKTTDASKVVELADLKELVNIANQINKNIDTVRIAIYKAKKSFDYVFGLRSSTGNNGGNSGGYIDELRKNGGEVHSDSNRTYLKDGRQVSFGSNGVYGLDDEVKSKEEFINRLLEGKSVRSSLEKTFPISFEEIERTLVGMREGLVRTSNFAGDNATSQIAKIDEVLAMFKDLFSKGDPTRFQQAFSDIQNANPNASAMDILNQLNEISDGGRTVWDALQSFRATMIDEVNDTVEWTNNVRDKSQALLNGDVKGAMFRAFTEAGLNEYGENGNKWGILNNGKSWIEGDIKELEKEIEDLKHEKTTNRILNESGLVESSREDYYNEEIQKRREKISLLRGYRERNNKFGIIDPLDNVIGIAEENQTEFSIGKTFEERRNRAGFDNNVDYLKSLRNPEMVKKELQEEANKIIPDLEKNEIAFAHFATEISKRRADLEELANSETWTSKLYDSNEGARDILGQPLSDDLIEKSKELKENTKTIDSPLNRAQSSLSKFAWQFDRATYSATQLNGVVTKLFAIVGSGSAVNDMITASSLRQTNQIMLASRRGMEEAEKLYDRIQMLVVKLPGNDTFLTNILTMLGTMDESLTAEDLEYMGGIIADYYMGAQAKGQFNNETERELRNYLMTGQTRNLTNSIIASEVESLKNLNSVKERTMALEKALQTTGMDSIAHYKSYHNTLEEFKGRFQKSFADLGDLYLGFLQGLMEVYNFLDSISGSFLSQLTISLGVFALGALGLTVVLAQVTQTLAGTVDAMKHLKDAVETGKGLEGEYGEAIRKALAWILFKIGLINEETASKVINTDATLRNTISEKLNSLSIRENIGSKVASTIAWFGNTKQKVIARLETYKNILATKLETLNMWIENREVRKNTLEWARNTKEKAKNRLVGYGDRIKGFLGGKLGVESTWGSIFGDVFGRGVNMLFRIGGAIVRFLQTPLGEIVGIVGLIITLLVLAVRYIGQLIGWWGSFGEMFQSFGDGIRRTWDAFVNSEPVQYMITTFQNFAYTLEGVFNLIRDIGGSIWEMVFGVDKGGNKVFDIVGAFLEVIGAIGNIAFMISPIRVILDVINAIGSAIAWALDTWNEFIDSAEFQGLLKDFQEIRGIIGEAWGTLTDAFNEVRDAFMSVFEDDDEVKEMVENTNILLEVLKAVATFLRVTVVPVVRLIAYIIKGIADVIKFVVDVGIGVVDFFTGGALTNEASSLPTQKQLAQSYSNRVNNTQTIINNNFASGSVLTDARNMTAKEVMKLFTSAFGFNKSRGVNGVLS